MNIRSMTDVERRAAAKAFAQTWKGRGDEKQDAQNFWRELLQSVYGVQKPEERDRYLADDDPLLAAFPYVNGGLFADENIEIPPINEEIYHLILRDASEDFDWSEISPTIFGAVFESTLNPETRRAGGMHYTSIENIHKVIDPLFLDDLKAEFAAIEGEAVQRTRAQKLAQFQDKLASLNFLDIKTPTLIQFNYSTAAYLQAGSVFL